MRPVPKSKNRGHTDSIEITCHLVVRDLTWRSSL
jgi:hypothetical protein